MGSDSRTDAVSTIGQTNKVQSDKQVAQGLVGIGLAIVYLADQISELVTVIREQPQQPRISIEIQNPGGTDENHLHRQPEGGNG